MITAIPHSGWQDEHIGQEVTLMMPHGTIDVIISIPNENRFLIGPATEIGMLVARMGIILPIVKAQDEFIMRFDKDEGEDEQ